MGSNYHVKRDILLAWSVSIVVRTQRVGSDELFSTKLSGHLINTYWSKLEHSDGELGLLGKITFLLVPPLMGIPNIVNSVCPP